MYIEIEVQCLQYLFQLQRSTKNNSHTKKYFHERHLYNGRYTQLTCLSEACQALRYDCQFAFSLLANSLFLSALKTSVSYLSRKRISHEHSNIKDISYQKQVFHCFRNIRFSSHFFCYI